MTAQLKVPAGLKARGKALWLELTDVGDHQLTTAEVLLAAEIARAADRLEAIDAVLTGRVPAIPRVRGASVPQLLSEGRLGQQHLVRLLAQWGEHRKPAEDGDGATEQQPAAQQTEQPAAGQTTTRKSRDVDDIARARRERERREAQA